VSDADDADEADDSEERWAGRWAGTASRGQLLVATPNLGDPNFERTVIYLLEHGDDGSLGVVLNRPSELPVSGTIDAWAPRAAAPARLFVGGPVSPSSVIALAAVEPDHAGPHWTAIAGHIGTVDLEMSPDDVGGVERVRLFAGFASWTPGQLDAELVGDSWFVVETELDDILTNDPESLWWTVLGRQPEPLRQLRHYPHDPSHN